VAIAEHGLVPSVVAARMTLAASPEAMQGAVAAGLLGCGSVILGSSQAAGEFLNDIVIGSPTSDFENAARKGVSDCRDAKRAIPGYGHPLHKDGDPRVKRLFFELARRTSISSGCIAKAAHTVESLMYELTGRCLVMNISAAIPAVLLDAGYPILAVKGVPILAPHGQAWSPICSKSNPPPWASTWPTRRPRPSPTTAARRRVFVAR